MNNKIKKLVSLVVCFGLIINILTGCSKSNDTKDNNDTTDNASTNEETQETGKVYYLNYKAEANDTWQAIAKEYKELKGVDVKIVTAPGGGQYETTLKSEISKKNPPTLFQLNGPMGYQAWKDYCLNIKDSKLFEALADKSLAIYGEDEGVYGVPYAIEGYGIVYNEAILNKYFELDNAKITSLDQVKNFESLKTMTEDMQARKDELGIEGVFASTSLAPGEGWRWQTHLANLPIFYEYKDKGVSTLDEIDFSYANEFKNIFDLYINNSCTKLNMLGAKNVNDSVTEFALGKVAMLQNGSWVWEQIADVEGNTVTEDNIKFMPIYTGVEGEESQGLCIGTENYFGVNSKASEADQKATLDFLEWLVTSDEGKAHMVNDLGIIAPFNTFSEDQKPKDPLAKSIMDSMDNDVVSVSWVFTTFPSQAFKDKFENALLEYVQGSMTWEQVVETIKTEWKSEMSLLQ